MQFEYRAKKMSGEEKTGVLEARDRFDLAKILREEGYTVISCQPKKEKRAFSLLLLGWGGVSMPEKIVFSRNLGVMVSAGVPIVRALDILARQTKNEKFKKIILSIIFDIQKGKTLSESIANYPNVFSHIFVAMVRVGEESGQLSESLKSISEQFNKDYTLRKKIKGAMLYPAIVVTAMILIGILMMIFVVPTLISTFEELGVELPTSTKIVVGVSNFLVNNTFIFILFLIIVVFLFILALKTKIGKKIIETISLKMPIISSLVKKINAARTGRTMALLIGSGINVLDALEITKGAIQNSYYKIVIENAKNDIQKGTPISESFKKASNLYTVLFGEMMSVGEETGKLSQMLFSIADFYEDEVADATKNMASVIEPFLMIIIGIVVGFFAISMISPMYSMMSGI